MRTLDEVLKDLNDAEKEYKEKCAKYGIEEKRKKRITNDVEEKKEDSLQENKINIEG